MMQMIQLLLHTSKQNSAIVTVPKTGGDEELKRVSALW